MRRLIAFLMFLLLFVGVANANWNSFVTNYDNNDYGDGTSTWLCSRIGIDI